MKRKMVTIELYFDVPATYADRVAKALHEHLTAFPHPHRWAEWASVNTVPAQAEETVKFSVSTHSVREYVND